MFVSISWSKGVSQVINGLLSGLNGRIMSHSFTRLDLTGLLNKLVRS